MKSFSQFCNEALESNRRTVNEGNTICSLVPGYDPDSNNNEEVAHAIDAYIEAIEAIKPAQLKKVKDFAGYDVKTLKDYATVCAAVTSWIWGVQSLADDDADEAECFPSYVRSIVDGEDWMGYENTVENLVDEGELKTVEDDEAVEDMLKDVLAHWNEISKIVNRKEWA
jgi:hypothetical protein